jgi:chaperonin GroES
MAINFVPLHDRVLIRRIEEQESTPSGIIIPDTAKDKPQEGEVLVVGKGKIKEDGNVVPLDVKPGDRILFGKYAGTEVNIKGEEYLIMREEEVLGITTKSSKRVKQAA